MCRFELNTCCYLQRTIVLGFAMKSYNTNWFTKMKIKLVPGKGKNRIVRSHPY